jgi:hypothetical protein
VKNGARCHSTAEQQAHTVGSPAVNSPAMVINSFQSNSIPSSQQLQFVDTLQLLNSKMDVLQQSIDNLLQMLSSRNEDGLEIDDFGLPVDTQEAMTAIEDQLRDKTKRAKLV